MIASRTPANVEKAVQKLRLEGAQIAGIAADCTTKEGIERAVQNTFRVGALALSKTMSAELGPYGITVNNLGTGGIATDQFKDVFTKIASANGKTYEEQLALLTLNIPVGRIGKPEDMAAAAFLCSNRAGYITGQVLVVDGGQIESLQ